MIFREFSIFFPRSWFQPKVVSFPRTFPPFHFSLSLFGFLPCAWPRYKPLQHPVSCQYPRDYSGCPCLTALSVAGRETLRSHAASIAAFSATGWATWETSKQPHSYITGTSICIYTFPDYSHTYDLHSLTFDPTCKLKHFQILAQDLREELGNGRVPACWGADGGCLMAGLYLRLRC